MHECVNTYMYINMHVCICVGMIAGVHICIHVCMHVYMYMQACMFISRHACWYDCLLIFCMIANEYVYCMCI